MHIKSYKQNRSIINGEIRMIEVEKMFDDFEFDGDYESHGSTEELSNIKNDINNTNLRIDELDNDFYKLNELLNKTIEVENNRWKAIEEIVELYDSKFNAYDKDFETLFNFLNEAIHVYNKLPDSYKKKLDLKNKIKKNK